MKLHPAQRLALAAALLLWGLASARWWLALPMALAMEAAWRVDWRWRFSDREYDRLVDLTLVAILLTLVWAINRDGSHGVLLVVQLLPLLLFPLTAVQRYSLGEGIQMGSLFLSLRARRARNDRLALQRVDLTLPLLGTSLLAAGTALSQAIWYFPAVAVIAALALLPLRHRQFRIHHWLGLVLLTVALAQLVHTGLRGAQLQLEEFVLAWLEDRMLDRDEDPTSLSTGIGQLGELKLSGRILWQVRAADPGSVPARLPRAIYQQYGLGIWGARAYPTQPLPEPTSLPPVWRIQPDRLDAGEATLEISGNLTEGRGFLPLPAASRRITGLLAESVERNQLGTTLARGTPDFVQYQVAYDAPNPADQGPAQAQDLEINPRMVPIIEQVRDEMGLAELPPQQVPARLAARFNQDFRYSLYRRELRTDLPPLGDFLLHSRSGHCEYFATSAVLLLRSLGIPARYVVGYAVQEYSELTDSFLLRRRHAHAWASAHIDGRWIDVDVTPPDWFALEQQEASGWQMLGDLWVLLRQGLQRDDRTPDQGQHPLVWVTLAVLFAILVQRLRRRRRERLQTDQDGQRNPEAGPITAFTQLMATLGARGLGPAARETNGLWLERLARSQLDSAILHQLREALNLHYRLRFSSRWQSADQRRLADLVGSIQATTNGEPPQD